MIFASLLIAVSISTVTQGRSIHSHSVPTTVDSYGNRVFLIRQQRNPMAIYPHRAMMITGMYQPKHRTSSRQATGVFAQGNAVSSDAYLDTNVPKYPQENSQPIEEPEISSAEAEASPGSYEIPIIDVKQNNPDEVEKEEEGVHDKKHIQTHQEEEASEYSTEAPIAEEPPVAQKGSDQRPTKANKPMNKGKKTKIHVDNADDDDDDDDEDDEEDEDDENEADDTTAIFNPFKGNRRSGLPTLNNFFPMVFSFPKSFGRRSTSGSSPPGMITAIANSYSTGKGGVASSVATAYGGSPDSKKKLLKSRQE